MKKIVGLLIVIIVVWGLVTVAQRWGSLPAYEALVTNEDAVLVVDQQPQDEVVVSYVKLSQPGYVLVYGDDVATGLSVVLGASSLLSAGEHKDVRVRYVGGSVGSVTAKIAHDDGDGAFDEIADQPLLADDGTEIASEAVLDVAADADIALSDEELVAELEAEGYDINEPITEEEVIDEAVGEPATDGQTSEETTDEGPVVETEIEVETQPASLEETATTSDEGVAN